MPVVVISLHGTAVAVDYDASSFRMDASSRQMPTNLSITELITPFKQRSSMFPASVYLTLLTPGLAYPLVIAYRRVIL